MQGIDLSYYQNGIKFAEIKRKNDFVILRAGYTGYGAMRDKVKDKCFEQFYNDAKKAGLKVGVYWFSCANDTKSGKAEAEYLYKNCLKGKKFEFPIYIDVENAQWQGKDKKAVTDAIIAFCEYLENKGYYVGIYASLAWFNHHIETKRLDAYTKWVACWTKEKPLFKYNGFDMWQYTDKGYIGNVRVDQDVAYKYFSKEFVSKGYNVYTKTKNGDKTQNNTPKDKDKNQKSDKTVVYVVKKGDTLSEIAKKYNTTVAKLVKANNIKDKNKIYVGDKIKIV